MPPRHLALALALPLVTGCAYADRVVFDADVNLRKARVSAEYREESLWHEGVDLCSDAEECLATMQNQSADAVAGIVEEGGEDVSCGYRLHDGRVDRIYRFEADLDAKILRTERSRVQPLTVARRRGRERPGLMVIQAPTDDDGVRVLVEASGRYEQLRTTDDDGAVTTAWLFTRGRNHVTLTLDTTATDAAHEARREWISDMDGLPEKLRQAVLIIE